MKSSCSLHLKKAEEEIRALGETRGVLVNSKVLGQLVTFPRAITQTTGRFVSFQKKRFSNWP